MYRRPTTLLNFLGGLMYYAGPKYEKLFLPKSLLPLEKCSPPPHDETHLTLMVSLKVMRFIEEHDLVYHAGGNILQSLHFSSTTRYCVWLRCQVLFMCALRVCMCICKHVVILKHLSEICVMCIFSDDAL